MSKTVSVTISVSTDTRVQGRYFVDVRDTTGGRDRQLTTRVLDDPAPFLAELGAAAAQNDVAVTVTDTTGELATAEQAAESAEIVAEAAAPAAPVADDLDSKKFPELLAIAKLHNVPGRGTARRAQLIAGIRAARGEADAAFRRAMSAPGHVHTPQPVTAPAVLPGRAAPALVWSRRREMSGRYDIHTRQRGSATEYRGVGGGGRQPIGHWHRRLSDAQAEVQRYHEDLHRAHNTAAAMEAARVAGDPDWKRLDSQMIAALTEHAQRSRPQVAPLDAPSAPEQGAPTVPHYDHLHYPHENLATCTLVTPTVYRKWTADGKRVRAAARPAKALSPLGELAAAYRQTHPPVR